MPPFVALTADATDETRRQSAEAGIDAYLTKPVDVDELLSLVDRLTRPAPAPAPSRAAAPVVVPHPRSGAARRRCSIRAVSSGCASWTIRTTS